MSVISVPEMNAKQAGESAQSAAHRLVHEFELLMQLFPNEHPSGIHGVLCITNNDLAQAIEVLLYLQRQVNRPAGTTAGVPPMTSFNDPQPSAFTCLPEFCPATVDTRQPVVKQEFSELFSGSGPSMSTEFATAMDLSNTAVKVDGPDKDVIICDSDEDEKHYVMLQPLNGRETEFTLQGLVPPVFRVASIHR